MARHFPSLPMQNLLSSSKPVTFFFVLVAFFSVFSMVTYLCASHRIIRSSKRQKVETTAKSGNKRLVSTLNSNISSKALLMVKMISWKKLQAEEDEEDEEAIWKKTIMMGERCQPLDFSGNIVYDSQGNPIPDPSHRKV
ncbi:hypothetical protein L1049_002257 [Liquidambar formosana]|uniref:Transmembrane protein n=1 Tax=Liquidambar formosana TaxID=63359 RepID=A0AAP0NEL1_LIQFO